LRRRGEGSLKLNANLGREGEGREECELLKLPEGSQFSKQLVTEGGEGNQRRENRGREGVWVQSDLGGKTVKVEPKYRQKQETKPKG